MSALNISLWRNIVAGLAVLGTVFVVAGAWASIAEIEGAIRGYGTVKPRNNSKDVQHLEGGIVREINVTEGSEVTAGEVLIELDKSQSLAKLGIIDNQIVELSAEYARLQCEQNGSDEIGLLEVHTEYANPNALDVAISGQQEILRALRETQRKKTAQLREQIEQANAAISGYEARLVANEKQILLAGDEGNVLASLNTKGLATRNAIVANKREQALLLGQDGELKSNIARLRTRISEIELKVVELEEQRRAEVIARISEVRAKLANLREHRIFEIDRLSRTTIAAPISGQVHDLKIFTVGGVIAPGQTLMTIVPAHDDLVFRVRIKPQDIDDVHNGQAVRLRFPSLNGRMTPEIRGEVAVVGADRTEDPSSHRTWFTLEVIAQPAEMARLPDQPIRPGLPVEAFILTQKQTILSYLLRPVLDQVSYAFRER